MYVGLLTTRESGPVFLLLLFVYTMSSITHFLIKRVNELFMKKFFKGHFLMTFFVNTKKRVGEKKAFGVSVYTHILVGTSEATKYSDTTPNRRSTLHWFGLWSSTHPAKNRPQNIFCRIFEGLCRKYLTLIIVQKTNNCCDFSTSYFFIQ